MKKGPIQGSICFKLVPGLLVLGPLSKVTLIDTNNSYGLEPPTDPFHQCEEALPRLCFSPIQCKIDLLCLQ